MHGNTLDDLLEKIENSNGHEEDAKKYWQELERIQAMPPVIFFTILDYSEIICCFLKLLYSIFIFCTVVVLLNYC